VPADITQALSQLDAMPCPKGVSQQTWAELTGALGEALAEQGRGPRAEGQGKTVSEVALTPPHGEDAAPLLVYSAAGALLSWGYFSPGDYDQNGVVGLSDLVPLAVHFGESAGTGDPFPENSIGAVIDGDGNGELNLADIIAIATNFGVNVEGYRIYAADNTTAYPPSPDAPNGTGTVYIGGKAFSDGAEPPGGGRKRFNYQVVPTATEQYYWVRPFDGAVDGAASNYVVVQLPPKRAPIAMLGYPATAETLAYIVWNAQTSFDPDGVITRYEWDFNGDGVYEYDSGTTPTADFYYYAPGDYTCTVRVTDDDTFTDTETGHISVTEKAKWHVNIVKEWDSEEPVAPGGPAQLLSVDGLPALFSPYGLAEPDPVTNSSQAVAMTRANDIHGESWAAPVMIRPGAQSFSSGAAAIVQGCPALAYTYVENDEYGYPIASSRKLKFVRAADAAGTTWTDETVVRGTTSAAKFLDLGDMPVLLVYIPTGAYYALSWATLPTGIIWADPQDLDVDPTVSPADFVVSGGLLGWLKRGQDVLYHRALDVAATAWGAPSYVNPLEPAGDQSQLLDDAGSPAVVYYETVFRTLRFRRATDSTGALWGPSVLVATTTKQSFRALMVDGRLALMYYDRLDGNLYYIAANNPEGTCWGFRMAIPYENEVAFTLFDSIPMRTCMATEMASAPVIVNFVTPPDTNKRLDYVTYY
jgi:hypothetical protein